MAAAPWKNRRRSRYSTRAHELDTRPARDNGQVVWWHGAADGVDHAFGAGGSGFLRSRCGAVRWSVLMTLVEGTVKPCAVCRDLVTPPEPAAAPVTESELRLLDGNR